MDAVLSWRDVLDCKIAGMKLDRLAKEAAELGYRFIVFNAVLYFVDPKGGAHETKTVVETRP